MQAILLGLCTVGESRQLNQLNQRHLEAKNTLRKVGTKIILNDNSLKRVVLVAIHRKVKF